MKRLHQVRRKSLVGVFLLLALASCKEGTFYSALGDQVATKPVSIAPAAGTIIIGSSLTFSATGGTPPYSFSLVSGPGAIDGSTGVFTASAVGAVVIRVTDKNKNTSDAKITITSTGLLDVDYTVSGFTHTGPLVAGGPLSESCTLQNLGTDAGSFSVQWTAYVSSDSLMTISAGDTVINAGTTGPIGAAPASTSIGITGTWPGAHGPYYLKVKVSAPDDTNTTNNIEPSAAVYTTTYVDYTPVSVQLNASGQVAGGPLSGEFQVQNLGNANGTQAIAWTAYVAPASTPTVVTYLSSGSTVKVNAGTTGSFVAFTGTWPPAPGNYVLVVSASSVEDTVPANNSGNSAGYGTTPALVDYAVSAVTNKGAATAAVLGAATGSFHLTNNGPFNGTQYVSWAAYASLSGLVDSSAVLVASGTWRPLAKSESADISFNGQWPMRYGYYQLVVSVTVPVDVDTNSSNNVAASGSVTAVGFIGAVEPNDDYVNLTNPNDLGIALQPGMSVSVSGELQTDTEDVFAFNTGTASSVTVYISWTAGAHDVTVYFMTAANTSVQSSSVLSGSSLSTTWVSDAPGVQRWIRVSTTAATIPSYTLILTGN